MFSSLVTLLGVPPTGLAEKTASASSTTCALSVSFVCPFTAGTQVPEKISLLQFRGNHSRSHDCLLLVFLHHTQELFNFIQGIVC